MPELMVIFQSWISFKYNVQMGNINKAQSTSIPPEAQKSKQEQTKPNQDDNVLKIGHPQQLQTQKGVNDSGHLQEQAENVGEVQNEAINEQQKELDIQDKSQKDHNSVQQQVGLLALPKININQSNGSKSLPPNTFRSFASEQIAADQSKSNKILKELIIENIPISEVKQAKLMERKRTLILWLKAGAKTQKQKQRDAVLIDKGYQLFTSMQIFQIKERYQEQNNKNIKMSTILLFSFSDYYNNEETIKQLHEYFILSGKLQRLFVVKPFETGSYQMHLSGIRSSKHIVQLSYQIQYIRQKIADYEVNQSSNSSNFITLKFWQDINGLNQIYQEGSKLEIFLTKSKVSLYGCLKVGQTLIEQLQERQYFKTLLRCYAFFHDFYYSEASITKAPKKKENYLESIGIKLLQDPINFYLNKTHQAVINRTLKYCVDVPECLNNIMLPLNLVFYKIKEQYMKDCASKRYRNNFVCFYETNLDNQQLKNFTKNAILQNLGFIKASLKQYDLKKAEFQQPVNAIFMINVPPTSKDAQTDNGYYFIGQNPKNIDQDEEQPHKDNYFTGFTHVLFNLLNSFLVTSSFYNAHLKKHMIELQYGYIATQINRRSVANFISDEEIAPRYIRKQQDKTQINYEAIIKYQSNKIILDKVEDEGDVFSLLARYNDSTSYYDAVFAKCKTEMSEDIILLSNFQNKKGLNLQLSNNPQHALQYFYNAHNFIRKSKKYSQIELNVLKCLDRSHQYHRMISFSETLIDIAKRHSFIDEISREFLLELYGLIAKAHLMHNSSNIQLIRQTPSIIKHFEQGLKIIQEIGEYNQIVPDFYYGLAYYYLISGKPFDALVYFNKGLLIKKAILTEEHPHLCPFYQILSVAYVAMHDYPKALNTINSCYFIYCKYYQRFNHRFLVVHELRGKIYALMNKIELSLQSFDAQIEIIDFALQNKRKTKSERKYSIKSKHIGVFNLIQDKQLDPYFRTQYRKDRSEICKVNVLLYQAKLYQIQYQFSKVHQILSKASILNKQELGETHILNLQILFLTIDAHIQNLEFKEAQKMLKSSFQILTKMRKENQLQAVRYYQLTAKCDEWKRDYKNCLKNLGKIKEIHFRIYGRQSLQNCKIGSKIGKINLLAGNSQQAKLYFVQHEMALQSMILKVKNDPKSTKLFGRDLDNYIKKIEIQQGQSLLNRGMLLQSNGSLDQAIVKYNSSIESFKEVIGQYHPTVAKVIYLIGCCYLKKGREECDRALQELKKALSIYKSVDVLNYSSIVQVHVQLSKAYQYKNELSLSVDELCQAIILLKKMHRVGIYFLQILQQIHRLVELIMSQPTISYLKNTYFIIAKLHSQTGELNKQSNQFSSQGHQEQYHNYISKILQQLVNKQEGIRRQIEKIETRQSKEQKDLLVKLEEKDHIISLQKIKENFQIRKKIRGKTKH